MASAVRFLVPRIFDASHLVQHAVTRLLSDGYFQAYRLPVIGSSLPSPLHAHLGPYPLVWAVSLLTYGTSLPPLNSSLLLQTYSQFNLHQYSVTCPL